MSDSGKISGQPARASRLVVHSTAILLFCYLKEHCTNPLILIIRIPDSSTRTTVVEKVYIAANNNIISIINKKNKNIMLVYTVAIQKKNLSKYYK